MGSRRASGFRRSSRHSYRLELSLEFETAIAASDAKEVARRITEAIRLSAPDVEGLSGLVDCRLVCHELRKVLPLTLDR